MVTAIAPGVLTPASEPEDPISDSSASVFHHTLITSDFKQLTFDAAASLQLQYKHSASGKHAPYHYAAAKSDHRLIVSPYNSPPHLLDLTSYDHATRLFAKALTIMQPIGDDYATADYLDSFNFGSIFAFLKQLAHAEGHLWRRRDFYVVTFRSQFKPDADEQRLFELDSKSHEEAMASGGLLKYWYGSKNEEFRNLATCIWRNRVDAYAGGKGPWHAKARAAVGMWYQSIVFRTYTLSIEDDVDSWSITDYKEDFHSRK